MKELVPQYNILKNMGKVSSTVGGIKCLNILLFMAVLYFGFLIQLLINTKRLYSVNDRLTIKLNLIKSKYYRQ